MSFSIVNENSRRMKYEWLYSLPASTSSSSSSSGRRTSGRSAPAAAAEALPFGPLPAPLPVFSATWSP